MVHAFIVVDVKLENLAKNLLAGNEEELMQNLRSLGINDLNDQNRKWYMDALAEALKKKRQVCSRIDSWCRDSHPIGMPIVAVSSNAGHFVIAFQTYTD